MEPGEWGWVHRQTSVDTQTQPTHTGTEATYRHKMSQTGTLKQGCFDAQTPGHGLTQMPESPGGACSLTSPTRLPGLLRAPVPLRRSLPPPPHARLSPSSCRPRSSHRAEPPPRSFPSSPHLCAWPPPSFSPLSRSPLCVPAASHSRSLAPVSVHLSISVSSSPAG